MAKFISCIARCTLNYCSFDRRDAAMHDQYSRVESHHLRVSTLLYCSCELAVVRCGLIFSASEYYNAIVTCIGQYRYECLS